MSQAVPPLPAPEHLRAARALLAWSQADLAKAAGVGISTIADFERGQRAPVANNAQAMCEALEAQGVQFLPSGVVIAAKMPPPTIPKPGKSVRWIEAHDLVQWGGTRDGQAMMPQLASRLLFAAHGPAAALRFPSGDSVQHAGWDGICNVATASTYVPAGGSAWEVGVQRTRIGQKAEDDYQNRLKDPLGIDPSENCFIFLTPQRWPQKDKWAAEKKKDCIWKDVRVIDGEMLVHWLEMYPGVAEWLAVRINRRPEGLRNLDAIWSEWSHATIPALSAELITVDRDEQAAKVLGWLYGPPAVLSLQAEASDEAMAFVRGTLGALPEDYRTYWETRILVAQSDDVARQLIGLGPKLAIIVDGDDPGVAAALAKDGHHVLRALGSDIGSPIDVLRLARPWRNHIERELEAMGVEREDAQRFAAASGRSLAVLRRLMTASPARKPAWANPPVASGLIAAVLAGSWRDDHPVDRMILERLAGCSYDIFSAALAPYAAAFDGPVRRSGSVWKLSSLRDTWLLLAPYLTEPQVKLLSGAFQEILSDRDPAFDADPDDRWKVDRDSPKRASGELRAGLTEAMVALGVFPERASGVLDSTAISGRNVQSLLDGADERLWWSLSNDFRLLSEAAPTEFLDAIESALDREPSPIAALFRSDEGFLHPREYLADLLWALEIHAWSPDHLAAVSLLLARLADINPSSRMGNRPNGTLRRIFLPWVPQTYATSKQRLQAIDLILKRYNRVGWELLLAIAPTYGGASTPSVSPRWRDYTVEKVEPVTRLGIARDYDAIGERLLRHAGLDPLRWSKLLSYWADFGDGWRETASAQLTDAVGHFDTAAAAAFREELRTLIVKHERFADAGWSMDAEALAPLKAIFIQVEPATPTARHAWLFKRGVHHFRRDLSWEEAGKRLAQEQRAAAEELIPLLSATEVVDYAATLDMPDALGEAIVTAATPEERKDEILDAAIGTGVPRAADMALRMLFALTVQRGADWLWARFDRAIADGRPLRELGPVLIALPVERATWDRIARAGAAIKQEYWRRIPVFRIPRGEEMHIACGKLLNIDRGRSALEMLVGPPDSQPSIADIRAILRHPSTIHLKKADADHTDAAMFTYYVGLAFQRLDADSSVPEAEITGLEWTYFHALQDSERPARLLHNALAVEPSFFVKLLKAIFGSVKNPDSEDDASREQVRIDVSQAFHVLENWSLVPGTGGDGVIDSVALEQWVNEARRLSAEADLADIGDSRIGQILSAARRTPGEAWPPEQVRDIIELCRSRELEEGFRVGLFNRRGVTVRLPTDGGEQERALAQQYRDDASANAFTWPRTRALLERIAKDYERDARWHDEHAEQRDWN